MTRGSASCNLPKPLDQGESRRTASGRGGPRRGSGGRVPTARAALRAPPPITRRPWHLPTGPRPGGAGRAGAGRRRSGPRKRAVPQSLQCAPPPITRRPQPLPMGPRTSPQPVLTRPPRERRAQRNNTGRRRTRSPWRRGRSEAVGRTRSPWRRPAYGGPHAPNHAEGAWGRCCACAHAGLDVRSRRARRPRPSRLGGR